MQRHSSQDETSQKLSDKRRGQRNLLRNQASKISQKFLPLVFVSSQAAMQDHSFSSNGSNHSFSVAVRSFEVINQLSLFLYGSLYGNPSFSLTYYFSSLSSGLPKRVVTLNISPNPVVETDCIEGICGSLSKVAVNLKTGDGGAITDQEVYNIFRRWRGLLTGEFWLIEDWVSISTAAQDIEKFSENIHFRLDHFRAANIRRRMRLIFEGTAATGGGGGSFFTALEDLTQPPITTLFPANHAESLSRPVLNTLTT